MSLAEILFFSLILVLAHAYLFYPALAWLLGGDDPVTSCGSTPGVSLLVPAFNESLVIEYKIRNFLSLDYPPDQIELVIADDGSSDETAQIAKRFEGERIRILLCQTRSGKAAAMNRLVDSARFPLLLFSDANVELAPDSVRKLVDRLSDDRVGAATGEVRLVNSHEEFERGEKAYYQIERRIQQAESRFGSVVGVDGGMYLMRSDLFDTLPESTILDDFLVSIRVMRAGKRIAYEPNAKAIESGTPSAGEEFARRSRIAAGAVQLLRRRNVPRWSQPIIWFQFISHKILRWFSPVLLTCLFATNVTLSSVHTSYQIFLAVQSFAYASVLLAWLIPPLRSKPGIGVLFYFGLSQLAMFVGLVRGFSNRQKVQWNKGERQLLQRAAKS